MQSNNISTIKRLDPSPRNGSKISHTVSIVLLSLCGNELWKKYGNITHFNIHIQHKKR